MRNKKKLCAGILMLLLLTGCSSQEVLQEVPQTIVLPESQIDTMPVQETAAAENDNTESFSLLEEGGSRFAYESLEAPEQIWYLEIEQALGEMEGTVKLSTDPLEQGLDEQDIDKIFQCVMIDHPEIFYATGYTYTKYSRGEKTVGIDFAGSYELTEEDAIVRAEQIRKITADWIRGIGEDKSEYEKVKAVYEQIIFATDYDLNAPDNQNICSVFITHRSVCQGYAKATQYLLQKAGIEATLIMGTVQNGEGHAWNLVKLDGENYFMDTTWGDASYQMTEGSVQNAGSLPPINYDYLCVTTGQLSKTHTIEEVVPVPVCTAMTDNYYVREGLYFTELSKDRIADVFARAYERQSSYVTLKCSRREVYEEIRRFLIEEQGIFEFLNPDTGTVSYAENVEQLDLSFWL